MKKYDFSKNIIHAGNEIKLSLALKDILGMAAKIENPLKFYGWYISLAESSELLLDEPDKKLLYNFIETNENIYLFVKGAILEILNNGNK